MDDLSSRISKLSPAKRALLELSATKNQSAESGSITPRVDRNRAVITARASFAQQRLWFLSQLEAENTSYNAPRAIRIRGPLRADALERSLNEIVQRHEVLRTTFSLIEGNLVQVIARDGVLPLPLSDLSEVSADQKPPRTKQLAKTEARQAFDLAQGPLIRARLIRLAADEHILILTTHHIVSDAWSAAVLFREIGQAYQAFSAGGPPLPPLAIQYADFAEWQRDWLQGKVLEDQLRFWTEQLRAAPALLNLPTDRVRPTIQTFRGAAKSLTLSQHTTRRLIDLSQQQNATLFMTMLAAFKVLLCRYSGQTDIIVGAPIAGRNRTEIENLIGFFINTLPLRTSLAGNPTFQQLLQRTREVALGAYGHQDVPFERLVEELKPERETGQHPIFQVTFQLQNAPRSPLVLPGLTITNEPIEPETAKFDLSLTAGEINGALRLWLEYSTDLFEAETIVQMLENFEVLLNSIVTNPEQHIGRLPLLTSAENHRLLVETNNTQTAFPANACIHELFEQQVEKTPNDVAIIFAGEELTYLALNQRANRLAHSLKELGVRPEVLVAICVDRGPDMIVGLLAILKAGGAYVPIDPAYPQERISYLLEDSRAGIVLTQQHLSSLLSLDRQVVCIDAQSSGSSDQQWSNLNSGVTHENAAHIIYTSGSTGKPKGVVGLHRAYVNRFQWMWQAYPFVTGEICCQKTALSFVDSVWEIFGPLLRGIPQVIIPDDIVKDGFRLVETLSKNKISRLVVVPSLLRVLLEDSDQITRLSHLRLCICSGETLSFELAGKFRRRLPNTLLINLYGSSEIAADVTSHEVHELKGERIPIGRPISNTQIFILNSNLEPVPAGVTGELHVAGESLTRGYLHRPDLTADRFVANHFAEEPGSRLFKTGDIGRYRRDGTIEHLGRRDHQIKIRGFRIELGEIEAALTEHPDISQSIVVVQNSSDEPRLLAYVLCKDSMPASNEIRLFLRQKLPDYMTPAAFVALNEFPLTASGKVNRMALSSMQYQLIGEAPYVRPRTSIEKSLAEIWSALLGIERISANDDFFALGGHSLLLAAVMSNVSTALNIQVPLKVLYESSTLSELAARLESFCNEGRVLAEKPLLPAARDPKPPLSFAQERVWFLDQMEPGNPAYNICRALRIRGNLDTSALQQSLIEILKRHEILRTTFPNDSGKPFQAVHEQMDAAIRFIDLTATRLTEPGTDANVLINEECQRGFDMAHGPLMRVLLLNRDAHEHLLVVNMHHIISDGFSMVLLFDELAALYNQFAGGMNAALPELPIQYADYAYHERLARQDEHDELDYWRRQLAGLRAVSGVPTDRPRTSVRGFHGEQHRLQLSELTSKAVKRLARSEKVTLFMALLAAFQVLLWWLSKEDDAVVGSPSAGRLQRSTEMLIGYFVNTLVLRTNLSGDPEFREVLRRVRTTVLGALAHQNVPLDKLIDEIQPGRTLNRNALFQEWFVLQDAPEEKLNFIGLDVEYVPIDSQFTRHDLQLSMWEAPSGLKGAFTYSTELFEGQTMMLMAKQFKLLVDTVVAKPDIRLNQLRLILDEGQENHRQQQAEQVAHDSRAKLRSIKRKPVREQL